MAAAAIRSAAPAASRASPTSSRRSSASSWTARRSAQNAARGADLRYDLELTLEEAFAGTEANITIEALAQCENCEGRGCSKHRRMRENLQHLRRRRQGPRAAGLLRGRARLPDLPRKRRSHRRSLPCLRRRRPRAQAPQAVGQHPCRRRRRHAHPRCRRRRSGRAQCAERRPLHLRPHEAAPDLCARGHDAGRGMPGDLHHRGAGRDDRPARHRRQARSSSRSRPASSRASSFASAARA